MVNIFFKMWDQNANICNTLAVCPPNILELLLAFSIIHALQQHGKVRMEDFRGFVGKFQTLLKSIRIWTNVSQQ